MLRCSLSCEVPAPVMDVMMAVEKNDHSLLGQAMTFLIRDASQLGLPKKFLTDIMQGLETGDWSDFAQGLKTLEFLGAEGRFFLLAPYTTSREAKLETLLSALYASRKKASLCSQELKGFKALGKVRPVSGLQTLHDIGQEL